MLDPTTELESLTKLTHDLKKASETLSPDEARFLVDAYYQIQRYRLRLANQIRSQADEPHEVLRWFSSQMEGLERNVQKALNAYSKQHPVGAWLRTIVGIGPVLASGFLAHIDIHKAPSAGHLFSFAGLVPGVKWEKGHKRPWNAELKRICWLAGECFCRVQNREGDVYGHIYAERKRLEQEANEAGLFADQAAAILESKRLGKTTDAYAAYSQGKLPPAHLHARAKRYAVKLFLSHLWEVWYRTEFKKEPPSPYVIEHMGHVHYLKPPNWPMQSTQPSTETDLLIEEQDAALEEEEQTSKSLLQRSTPVEPKTLTLAEKLTRFKQLRDQRVTEP
jgi:hypothetical protein